MNCKNCNDNLQSDFYYCPSCGGKVIQSRITWKGLWSDFYQRFFDIDNTFLRTFRHMFSKPEEVIQNYVEGVRRRYMNPMSYLAVSLALSGVFLFIMQHGAADEIDLDILGTGVDTTVQKKIMDVSMEFSSLILMLYIPIIALAGYLSFNSRNYNMPEYLITGAYVLSHFSIATVAISGAMAFFFPKQYLWFSFLYLFVMFCYILYVLIRLHPIQGVGSAFLRLFIFCAVFGIGYLLISSIIPVAMMLNGMLTPQEFLQVPK